MSGFEAVGVLFGILPLLISTAEPFDVIFRSFSRYRTYTAETTRFQVQLQTQRHIFRNGCGRLLASLLDRNIAQGMLEDWKHHLWKNNDLNARFARELGHSYKACEGIVQLIKEKLADVEKITHQFVSTHSLETPRWSRQLRQKLTFYLSRTYHDQSLKGIRALNADFLTLASQVDGSYAREADQPVHDKSYEKQRVVENFGLVQQAFVDLYGALVNSCDEHAEHVAKFRLEPQYVPGESDKTAVRFELAFNHGRSLPAASSADMVWFAIESTTHEAKPKEGAYKQPLQNKSKSIENLVVLTNTLRLERQLPNNVSTLARSIRGASSQPAPSDTLIPDFCEHNDLCVHVHKLRATNTCIGYLERNHSSYRHSIYLRPPDSSPIVTEPFTLSQLFHASSQESRSDAFLTYDRIRLAGQLARAVLYYQGTPLLGSSLRSENVIFFNPEHSLQRTSLLQQRLLESPHISIHLQAESPNRSASEGLEECVTYQPNSYLFGLGTLLIELAYLKPWSILQDLDIPVKRESIRSDYLVAKHLSKNIGSELGRDFAKLVWKCVSCDFGLGSDNLSDPELQFRFYEDVVCELENLEKGFGKLQLGV
ncbi:hypothetical protein MMC25_000820 [Agyrium rufum]|nr:hypothetical protein [Agyrium rufum]